MFRTVAGLAIMMAVLGWKMTRDPSNSLASTLLGQVQRFNYDSATEDARYSFLYAQAGVERAASNQKLAGTGFRINDFTIDTARKRVTFHFSYPSNLGITKASIRADKPVVLGQTCPPWSKSTMGREGVSWIFSYRDSRKQPVGAILVNAGSCHPYL